MRASWFVERITRGAAQPHWRAERATLAEVLEDLHAAEAAGDVFRFIAPWHATDEELDDLIRRGAMPTFSGADNSDVNALSSENLKEDGESE